MIHDSYIEIIKTNQKIKKSNNYTSDTVATIRYRTSFNLYYTSSYLYYILICLTKKLTKYIFSSHSR